MQRFFIAEFLELQAMVHGMFESIPLIEPNNVKNENDLIFQLQNACLSYGKKLITIFDKYSNLAKKSNNSDLQNIAKFCGVTPHTESAIKVYLQTLQGKVQYLNQQLEELTLEARQIRPSEALLQKQLKYENQIKQELEETIQKLMDELRNEKLKNSRFQSPQQLKNSIIHHPSKETIYDETELRYGLNTIAQILSIEVDDHTSLIDIIQLVRQNLDWAKSDNDRKLERELQRFNEKARQCVELEQQVTLLNEKERLINQECQEFQNFILSYQDELTRTIQRIVRNGGAQQELQQLLENDKIFERINAFSKVTSEQTSFKRDNTFKDRIRQDQLELKQKIRMSLAQLEDQKKIDENNTLQREIEKSAQLQSKFEKNNLLISRMLIIIEEGTNRSLFVINQLINLADSNEAQRLLQSCRREIEGIQQSILQVRPPENTTSLKEIQMEFTRQRDLWLQQFEQIKISLQDQEVETMSQNNLLQQKLKEAEEDQQKMASHLTEYDTQLRSLSEMLTIRQKEIDELQKTYDIMSTEMQKYKKENQLLKRSNEERIQSLEDEKRVLSSENKTFRSEISKIEADFKSLKNSRSNLENQMEKERSQLKKVIDDWRQKYESQLSQSEQLKVSYYNRIEELKNDYDQLEQQYFMKENEVKTLNKTLFDLEEFSKKQLDLIKNYEDQLNNAYSQKIELEMLGSDSKNLQEKNQKYLEKLQETNRELDMVKRELKNVQEFKQSVKRDQFELNNRLQEKEKESETFREKATKQSEIIQILREENRNLRLQVDVRVTEVREKDNELEYVTFIFNFERKVQKFTRELQQQINELQIKLKHILENGREQEIQKENQFLKAHLEELQKEIDKIRYEKQIRFQNEPKQDETYNQMKDEICQFKRELQKMEQLLDTERNIHRESLEKLYHLEKQQQKENQQIPSQRQIYPNSAFYENLIETKDQEIARLTQILRSVTDNFNRK